MTTKTLLKTSIASSLVAALLAMTTGCATPPDYNAYGGLYEDIYKDSSIYKKHKKTIKTIDKDIYRPAIEQTAANKVSNMGYRVKDVKYKKGDRTIKVKAEKNRQNYKVELGYPNYNVINIKKD